MVKKFIFANLFLFLSSLAFAAEQEHPFARDLERVAEWFEGEFDNEEQLWFHTRSGSTKDAPTRLHISNKRLDLPAFGKYVFYSEEYADNDPENIVRQRLVVFSADLKENAIRMQQGIFNDASTASGDGNLDWLKSRDVALLDGCDVFLLRVADQLHGSTKSRRCLVGDNEKHYSRYEIILSAKKYWRVDATFSAADDSFVEGTPVDRPTELRRAKVFFCDYYFYKENGGNFPEGSGLQVVENLRVHSQGGIGTAVRKSDGQVFEILIREKEYPYHVVRSDFVYYSLRLAGETKSIVYGVADRAARQFGTSTVNIGVFCHREGYTFNETFE